MKIITVLLLIIIIMSILVTGCNLQEEETTKGIEKLSQKECLSLKENFDEKTKIIDSSYCINEWKGENIWAVGTVIDISPEGAQSEDTWYSITLQGVEEKRVIYVASNGESPKYSKGQIYKFDLAGSCPLITSSQNSGKFTGSIKQIECED